MSLSIERAVVLRRDAETGRRTRDRRDTRPPQACDHDRTPGADPGRPIME
ncbi:hypothetical protein FHS43_006734 [Streptosporangium becharense]|uniref:Uncharacterized protein n=1 Tax=Streptosporangium becharense TaxID=1816182 RepID=A0A7W9MEL6_9ACTN|nr:hypothetical protein [Streptosporangium becharense]MBB2915414.1 hypothetical protein [Streptosporangium becharense]MBB5817601.1 hypothetical protein [Streptosporangium becharense]